MELPKPEFTRDCPYGHQTREGQLAQVLRNYAGATGTKMAVLITNSDGSMYIRSCHLDGKYGEKPSRYDIIDRAPPSAIVEADVYLVRQRDSSMVQAVAFNKNSTNSHTLSRMGMNVLATKRITLVEGEFDFY